MPTMISVPTTAWATPPPVSPAGAGVLVKKSSERLPAPLATRLARMKKRGSSATTTATTMSPTIAWLKARRSTRRFTAGPSQRLAPGPGAAGDPPDQEARAGVHHDGHHEEQEGDGGQTGRA